MPEAFPRKNFSNNLGRTCRCCKQILKAILFLSMAGTIDLEESRYNDTGLPGLGGPSDMRLQDESGLDRPMQ